jgi:hypothetical protein
MSDIHKLDSAIQTKWRADAGLKECRGYVFNLEYSTGQPALATAPVDVLIVGMNPGEAPERAEGYSKTSERRWLERCQFFADAAGGIWATTELVFWSSKNLNVLKDRVGDLSPYLAWCAGINNALIAFHKPKLIFQPGLGWASYAIEHYGLRHKRRYHREDGGKTLIDHYEMPDGTPWLCTPHWTAAFGFSRRDRELIREEASRMLSASHVASDSG